MNMAKLIEVAIYVAFVVVLMLATTGSWHFYALLALFIAGCCHDYSRGLDKGTDIALRAFNIPTKGS